MKLEDAWLTLLDMDTTVIRTPSQIYSILSDLGVFKDYPKIRLAVNSALQNGLWELVSSNSVSQTDIDKLKSGLEYDGFSDVIINEIINSFYKPAQSNNNCQPSETPQNPQKLNSNPSSLTFLGIPLGCKLEDFLSKLPKDYDIDQDHSKFHITDKDIKYWLFDYKQSNKEGIERLKNDSSVICYGNFAGLEDCDITIYYCPFSEIVYKISIWNSRVSSDTIFKTICQAYTNKYGTPRKIFDSDIKYIISKFESIEISYLNGNWFKMNNDNVSINIEYLDSRWADYDDDKIKQKQEELASEMQNKIIIDGI